MFDPVATYDMLTTKYQIDSKQFWLLEPYLFRTTIALKGIYLGRGSMTSAYRRDRKLEINITQECDWTSTEEYTTVV